MKQTKASLSAEDVKRIYFDPINANDGNIVRESIWRAHWHNARTAATKQFIDNLLTNHIRLAGIKADENGNRAAIITFLRERLEEFA